MVTCCTCAGCSNSHLSGHRVHVFPPRNSGQFNAWVQFVQATKRGFTAASVTPSTTVCGAHFREQDYVPGDMMQFKMGFRSLQRVRLLPGAVPSVPDQASSDTATGSAGGGSRDSCSMPLGGDASCTGTEDSPVLLEPKEEPLSPPAPDMPSFESHQDEALCTSGILCPDGVSVGTPTRPLEDPCSTPLAATEQSDGDSLSSHCEQPGLSTWSPGEDTLARSSDEESSDESRFKFMVCHSQLLSLFTMCPICSAETRGSVVQEVGSFIQIEQVCSSCGHVRLWQNQPTMHGNMATS